MAFDIQTPACALYIDGEWHPSDDREAVINPATEETIGEAPVGAITEANAALDAARGAFDNGPWRHMKPAERQSHLQAFHDAIERRSDHIRQLITAEAGVPQWLASGLQYAVPMAHAQFFIDQATREIVTSLPVELFPTPNGNQILGAGVTVREPIGVCAAITPFNAPFMLNVGKVFPALATGNTVVLKPSPYTPYSALVLGEAAAEAKLPKGVLNIVTGRADVGSVLTTDKRVDLVSFTGSDAVGSAIQAQSAPTLKRLLLELGGKSALIVRADADLRAAAASATIALTQNSGQGCAVTSRVLVHNSIRAEFVRLLVEALEAVKIGNPADGSVRMGPMIRESQRARAEFYVELALQEGGKLLTGGGRPAGFDKGFYYSPTLFDEVQNDWRIAQEEVFGPVVVTIGFDTDEEAIAIANDSEFGLSGGIFSTDVGRAYEIALQIRTGRIGINGGPGGMSVHAPFGGIKRSGYGREYGIEGLNEFTYLKAIGFKGG